MRTALVHYWLVRMRGGEQVLRHLMRLHPEADVITNVYDPEATGELFYGRSPPRTTSVNRLPCAKSAYPLYMPLMLGALQSVDMSGYDLVISSESGPAKWVIPNPNARHVCYVHSPMRYLWDQRFLYRAKVPAPIRPLFDIVTDDLRYRDVASAARVDEFVANSSFVQRRINRYYRRDSVVIHPPVPQDDFGEPRAPEDYFLFAGQLLQYKGIRDAVDACVASKRRLIVVGDGPERDYVIRRAEAGIEYRGRVSRAELVDLMGKCRALLFPGVEDFGLVPVEVLAAGRPVVALGEGGALDSITEGLTGFFYHEPSAEALVRALDVFDEWESGFDPQDAVREAARFAPHHFDRKWRAFVEGGSLEVASPNDMPIARLAS